MVAIIKMAKTKQILKEICAVCNTEGIITPVEKLSFDGLMMQAVHDDGTTHRWSSYKSLFDLGSHKGERNEETKTVVCPRCGRRGIIQSIRDRKKDIMRYRISHENLPSQDKQDKRKQDLCFISKKEHRIIVLKALDRFIPRTKQYAICPKCGKEGRISIRRHDKHRHPDKYRIVYVHEPLEGYWGRSKKTKSRRMRLCYMPQSKMLDQQQHASENKQ